MHQNNLINYLKWYLSILNECFVNISDMNSSLNTSIGIVDAIDNCPFTAHLGQEDGDLDEVGDACDNCNATVNKDQSDTDQDGFGDACSTPGSSNNDR